MKYEVFYTKKSWYDLQKIPILESRKIVKKIKQFSEQPDPLKHAKSLKGMYKNAFRFRLGDYRAIFTKDPKGTITILTIIRIQHRKDIYQ